MATSKDTLDNVLEEYGDLQNEHDKEDMVCITLWIPISYKKKYARLQGNSKRFSKVVRKVFMQLCDRAEERTATHSM